MASQSTVASHLVPVIGIIRLRHLDFLCLNCQLLQLVGQLTDVSGVLAHQLLCLVESLVGLKFHGVGHVVMHQTQFFLCFVG